MGANILSLDQPPVEPTAKTQERLLESPSNNLQQLREDMTKLAEDNTKMKKDMSKLLKYISKLDEDNTKMKEDNTKMKKDISKLEEDLAQEKAGRLGDEEDMKKKVKAENLRCVTKHGNLVKELAAVKEEQTRVERDLEQQTAELAGTRQELQNNIDYVARVCTYTTFQRSCNSI